MRFIGDKYPQCEARVSRIEMSGSVSGCSSGVVTKQNTELNIMRCVWPGWCLLLLMYYAAENRR